MVPFEPPDVGNMEAKRDVNGLIRALSYKRGKYGTCDLRWFDAEEVREAATKALGKIGDYLMR